MLTTVFLLMVTMVMSCRCVADYDGDDANDDGDGDDTMMIIMTIVLLKFMLTRLKGRNY